MDTCTTTFNELQTRFEAYRKQAGNPIYIACFGKTFLDPQHEAYTLSEYIGNMIVEHGFGILHGGYIGSMEAVSKGANTAIQKDKDKNIYWNIGVPMHLFDADVKRSSSVHLPAAKDLFDRKKALISFCDACVVLPHGGFGTLLEALEIFHINQIAEKFGGKIRPLFFVGTHWKLLFESIYSHLDMHQQSHGGAFTHFLDSAEDLKKALEMFKINQI